MKLVKTLICLAAVTALAGACASNPIERDGLVRVKPWERDALARGEMGWDPSPVGSAFRKHIFFAKEASLVGGSAGGGGCGCN